MIKLTRHLLRAKLNYNIVRKTSPNQKRLCGHSPISSCSNWQWCIPDLGFKKVGRLDARPAPPTNSSEHHNITRPGTHALRRGLPINGYHEMLIMTRKLRADVDLSQVRVRQITKTTHKTRTGYQRIMAVTYR